MVPYQRSREVTKCRWDSVPYSLLNMSAMSSMQFLKGWRYGYLTLRAKRCARVRRVCGVFVCARARVCDDVIQSSVQYKLTSA